MLDITLGQVNGFAKVGLFYTVRGSHLNSVSNFVYCIYLHC